MPEYTVPTGSGGTLKMSDNGTTVKFYIKAGSSATFCNDKAFSWSSAHDGAGSGTFDYSTGAAWLLVKTLTITETGTVSFTMGATGTSGLGGPTTISHSITRDTPPSAPRTPTTSDIRSTSFDVNYLVPTSDGGDSIAGYHIWYGLVATLGPSLNKYVGPGVLTNIDIPNLKPSTRYYWAAAAYNVLGDGTKTAVITVDTLATVLFKTGGFYRKVMVFIKTGGVYKQAMAYVKVGGVYKETGA